MRQNVEARYTLRFRIAWQSSRYVSGQEVDSECPRMSLLPKQDVAEKDQESRF